MAERNFDEEFDYEQQEGHTFTLGGYEFHTKAVVPPGAFLNVGRGLVAAVTFLRRVVLPEERVNLERIVEMPDSSAALLDAAPELLAAAKTAVRAEKDGVGTTIATEALASVIAQIELVSPHDGPMISAHEVDVVADWLMEVTIGRPTNAQSQSSNGAARTSNGSKVTSSKAARAGKN